MTATYITLIPDIKGSPLCLHMQNDGFHWRVPWFYGVEEEFDKLREQMDEHIQNLWGLQTEMKQMSEEQKKHRGVLGKTEGRS